jgi:hypothetical protein
MKRSAPDVASGKSVHATLLKLAVPLGTTPELHVAGQSQDDSDDGVR